MRRRHRPGWVGVPRPGLRPDVSRGEKRLSPAPTQGRRPPAAPEAVPRRPPPSCSRQGPLRASPLGPTARAGPAPAEGTRAARAAAGRPRLSHGRGTRVSSAGLGARLPTEGWCGRPRAPGSLPGVTVRLAAGSRARADGGRRRGRVEGLHRGPRLEAVGWAGLACARPLPPFSPVPTERTPQARGFLHCGFLRSPSKENDPKVKKRTSCGFRVVPRSLRRVSGSPCLKSGLEPRCVASDLCLTQGLLPC